MADKQIAALNAVSTPDGTELVHVVQGGNSRKATVTEVSGVARKFTYGYFLEGNASNVLLRNPSTGATRLHIEPKGRVAGTAAKFDLMFDPYQDDGTNYRILNSYTKNYSSGDSHTTQGDHGVGCIGAKAVGDKFGINPSIHFGFSDFTSTYTTPMKLFYFDTSDSSWRTPMIGSWEAGISVTSGDYALANNKLYQSGTTGTTGVTKPSHTSSSASDGTVTWTFVRDYSASSGSFRSAVLFGLRDDMPKFGLSGVVAQFARDAAFWNGKKLQFLDGSNAVAWSVYTNGATDDLYIESADSTARLRLDSTGKFLQIIGLGVAGPAVTATDADTSPTIKGVRTLLLSNTGATTITAFDDGIPYQEFYVRASNGNTTLQHSASLTLIGATNKTLATSDVLLFQMNGAGTAATQVT